MKTNSRTTADQDKYISSTPTNWLKFYEEAVIVWGPKRRRAIKE